MKLRADQFQCAACDGVFVKGWSDAESLAECRMIFGDVAPEHRVLICDECFQKIHPAQHPAEVADAREIAVLQVATGATRQHVKERKRPRCFQCGCPDLRVERMESLPAGGTRRFRRCRNCGFEPPPDVVKKEPPK